MAWPAAEDDMAQAAQHVTQEHQLGFFGRGRGATAPAISRRHAPATRTAAPLCAGCRAKEARYGFRRHDDDPSTERPRTLCFECFRMELSRRQTIAEQLARGWNASQAALPLDETLNELTRRRRRAQIAARKALGL
jgi:hypothetical protein